jgi:rare lipoprotein A (peptidoglycan hydrolase)
LNLNQHAARPLFFLTLVLSLLSTATVGFYVPASASEQASSNPKIEKGVFNTGHHETQSSLALSDSVSVQPMSVQSVSSPAVVPVEQTEGKTEPVSASMKQVLKSSEPLKAGVNIQVRPQANNGQVAVLVKGKEISRFRSAFEGKSASQRANQFSANLSSFLNQGGNPRDIKPGLEGKKVVVRAGARILAVVDDKLAKEYKVSNKALAISLANRLRETLGAGNIDRTTQVASRAFLGMRPTGVLLTGMASWYGPGFHGRRCANGSRFDMYAMTAAHKTLPFGTIVKVKNHNTGRSCLVKITDRGPYAHGRIIDLSKGAAQAIGLLGSGVGRVSVEVMKPASPFKRPSGFKTEMAKAEPVKSIDFAQMASSPKENPMQALVNPIGPLEMAAFSAENPVKVDVPVVPSVVVHSASSEIKAEEAVSTLALATEVPAVIPVKSVLKASAPSKKLSAAQLKKQALLKKQEAARKNALAWKAKQAAKQAKLKAEKLALAKKQAEQKKLVLAKKQALLKKQAEQRKLALAKKQAALKKPVSPKSVSAKSPLVKSAVSMPAVEAVKHEAMTEQKKPESFEPIDLTPPEPSAMLKE